MRLLLIEDDPPFRERLRARLHAQWPEAQLQARNPARHGPLAPEFRAQAYDAVLLAAPWQTGGVVEWLRDLAARPGFAPLIFLSERSDDADANEARRLGVHAVLGREEVDANGFVTAIATAEQARSFTRAVWRSARDGREAQLFSGAFIRGYRNIRRLAAGPVADLYLAESEQAGALVALKVARDRHEEQAGLDDSFRRFLQEYAIVRRIQHPNIVQLYDLGVSDEHAWLVMEYFREGDLRRRMKAGMAPQAGLVILPAVARALQAIHAAGILHRDLKPGNIMFRDDGSPALIDFGLSKDLGLALDVTATGMIFGTPHYMSPEQGHGEPIDARSDLYSLGVILYEMITRAKPFTAENPMAIIYLHRKEPVPRLPRPYAYLQPTLERLMAKRPEDRFASAQEAAGALEQVLGTRYGGAGLA